MRKSIYIALSVAIILNACSTTPSTKTKAVKVVTNTPRITATSRSRLSTRTQQPNRSLGACLDSFALNVRAGPGKEHPIIGGLENGECVNIDATSDDGCWGRTENTNWLSPVHGWVAISFFTISGNTNSLLVRSPDVTPTIKYIIPTSTRRPVFIVPPAPTSPPRPSGCDSCYPYVCIPISSRDLDCCDVRYSNFYCACDPHGFDGDHDGWGCEWGCQ